MLKVWKEILVPGRVFDPKTKRWYTFTQQDISTGARNLSAMHSRGRGVPAVWEHQDVEVGDPADWRANYARHTFAYLGPARVSTPADVQKGIATQPGTLLARHDLFDARDAEQLKRLKVSPKVYNGYQDSDGASYNGLTVVHSAATPTPCQFWQAPFQIELSDSTALYLAYPKPSRKPKPRVSPRPSVRRGTARTLSTTNPEPTVADEKDDDKDMGGEGEEGGKNADLTAVCDALRKKGMNIPDAVEDWKHLLIAIEANGASEPDGDEAEEEAPENPDETLTDDGAASGEDVTAPPGGPLMLMSTLDRDPKRREHARAEVKPERDDAKARVNAALKAQKCDGPTARKLLRVFDAVALSVTAEGDVVDAEPKTPRWAGALKALADIEKQRPGAAVSAVELSATGAGPGLPVDFSGAKHSPERAADTQAVLAGKMSLDAFNAKHK